MADLDLDAIRQRYEQCYSHIESMHCCRAHDVAADVPALLNEVVGLAWTSERDRTELERARPVLEAVEAWRSLTLDVANLLLERRGVAIPAEPRPVARLAASLNKVAAAVDTWRKDRTAAPRPRRGGTPRRRTVAPRPGELFSRSDVSVAVAAFHTAFGLPQQTLPNVEISDDLAQLRIALLEEEVREFVVASGQKDIIGIADALADIATVVYGTALTYGIDLDLVLGEVYRSNMSKLDRDGKPLLRADGKVIKSDLYSPPNIGHLLDEQLPLAAF